MADDFSKKLGIDVKANLDPSGFERGSDRIIASAEHQRTALEALRKSSQELQQLQQVYLKTPELYAQQRAQYTGRGASIFSPEAEKLRLASLEHQIRLAGGTAPTIAGGGTIEELEQRDITTRRLRGLVEEKFSQFGGMSRTQRKALMGDVQPHIQELQRRYGATQSYYSGRVREATAEFEAMSGEDQLKNLDAFNHKIQVYEDNARKARVASDELAKSTKKFTEEAGLASKSIPAYAASVVNMGITIGQGIAQISRAGALAFDYSSPYAMYSAQQQFEIQRSKTLWNTGGSIIGQIGGAAVGAMTGINPFAASYIGGMLGGGAGDIISTFLNIEPERQLKYMGQMYGKSSQAVDMFTGIQGQEYGISRRTAATPAQIAAVLRRYGNLGIDQAQAAQIANQYVNATGSMSVAGLDEWINMYVRTGIMPHGLLEKISGGSSVNMLANAGLAMGLPRARYADLSQFMQQATSVAGRLFTNPMDIERATSMTMMLPYTLYGEGVGSNRWATSFEGMQQISQGFQALGQSKNTGEQAFLFNALNQSGQSWRETLLRMQEGIYGKGNLRDILQYTRRAYGGRGGDALFSMLSEKGVNPDIVRKLVGEFEGNYSGLIARIGEGAVTEKDLYKKLGMTEVSPLARIKAGESIAVTESARGMAEAFATGLAQFNVQVARLATGADTQRKIQDMLGNVIRSVEEAFQSPKPAKPLNQNDFSPEEWERIQRVRKSMQSLVLPDGKKINFTVETTTTVNLDSILSTVPRSQYRTTFPSHP